MELGQHQLQIFVGLLVVAATCVALICDFLKRNNEQLRELAVELKVRRDEDWRRTAVDPIKQRPERRVERPAARVIAAPLGRKRTLAPKALAAMERGAKLAGVGASPRSKAQPETPATQVPPTVKKRDWNALLSSHTPRATPNPAGLPERAWGVGPAPPERDRTTLVFSWGGVEVRSESIDEAIASANERMHETRRGRRLLIMGSPGAEVALRQAG